MALKEQMKLAVSHTPVWELMGNAEAKKLLISYGIDKKDPRLGEMATKLMHLSYLAGKTPAHELEDLEKRYVKTEDNLASYLRKQVDELRSVPRRIGSAEEKITSPAIKRIENFFGIDTKAVPPSRISELERDAEISELRADLLTYIQIRK